MRLLIIFILMLSNSFASAASDIKNLEIYFDSPNTLAKKFKLRGLPTTIFFNKDGLEFARIIGSIDFVDEKFIKWLSNFN